MRQRCCFSNHAETRRRRIPNAPATVLLPYRSRAAFKRRLTALDSRPTSHLHPRTETITHLTQTHTHTHREQPRQSRSRVVRKVGRACLIGTCCTTHEDCPSMSEQQSGICHFMSVSLYLQPVLGRYGWIKAKLSSPRWALISSHTYKLFHGCFRSSDCFRSSRPM